MGIRLDVSPFSNTIYVTNINIMAVKIDDKYPSYAQIEYDSKVFLNRTGHYPKYEQLLNELQRVVKGCCKTPKVVRFAQFEFHFTEVFMNHPFYEITIL